MGLFSPLGLQLGQALLASVLMKGNSCLPEPVLDARPRAGGVQAIESGRYVGTNHAGGAACRRPECTGGDGSRHRHCWCVAKGLGLSWCTAKQSSRSPADGLSPSRLSTPRLCQPEPWCSRPYITPALVQMSWAWHPGLTTMHGAKGCALLHPASLTRCSKLVQQVGARFCLRCWHEALASWCHCQLMPACLLSLALQMLAGRGRTGAARHLLVNLTSIPEKPGLSSEIDIGKGPSRKCTCAVQAAPK